MSIDLKKKPKLITMGDGAALVAVLTGKRLRPHVTTVSRWCTRGCRGRVLEAVRIGGVLMTTEAAIHDFILAGAPTPPTMNVNAAVLTGRKPRVSATHEAAKRRLAAKLSA